MQSEQFHSPEGERQAQQAALAEKLSSKAIGEKAKAGAEGTSLETNYEKPELKAVYDKKADEILKSGQKFEAAQVTPTEGYKLRKEIMSTLAPESTKKRRR